MERPRRVSAETGATREAESFPRLLDAMVGVASGLSLPTMMRHIVESAVALVDARFGALGVLDADRGLAEFVSVGMTDDELAAIGPFPEGHGILGLLIAEPQPLRLRDLTTHPASYGFPEHHPVMRSFLGVPIRIGDEVFGNLYLCEKRGAEEFDARDEQLVTSLAAIAAVGVENARLHARLQDLAVLRDRERIARDLHDKIVQRLFAAGLTLQVAGRLPHDELVERVESTVDELDRIVNEIRATIFDLEIRPSDRPGLHASVLALVDEMTRPVGIEASVHLGLHVERDVTPDLAGDVLAVLREALANAMQHGRPRHVDVELGVEASHLVVRVTDDGRGIDADLPPAGGRGHGLRNLAARAVDRGGTFGIRPGTAGGTTLEWAVPMEIGTFAPPIG